MSPPSRDPPRSGRPFSLTPAATVFIEDGRQLRVARDGQKRSLLRTPGRPNTPRFSQDGQLIYLSVIEGPRENHDIWRVSIKDGKSSRLTKLEGRRGRLGYVFSADDRYLYFTWYEDEGDIWVMDVAPADAK